jgi:hypothetical protein
MFMMVNNIKYFTVKEDYADDESYNIHWANYSYRISRSLFIVPGS